MAMTEQKIREAFGRCVHVIRERYPYTKAQRGGVEYAAHLLWMCEEGPTYAANRREKAMRWLGFVQGAMWILDLATIEQLKAMNRPDEEA